MVQLFVLDCKDTKIVREIKYKHKIFYNYIHAYIKLLKITIYKAIWKCLNLHKPYILPT